MRILPERLARLRRPRGVTAALKQLISAKLVREIEENCTIPGEILERVADREGYSKTALLNEVAGILGLPVRKTLHIPSVELLGTIEMTPVKLCERAVLPQENKLVPQQPVLAVADPASCDIQSLQGFRQELCLSSEIHQTWCDLNSFILGLGEESRAERQLLALLRRLATDASKLGAEEVFVGVPSETYYEIHARTQVYRGTIGESIYRQLADWVPIDGVREFALNRATDGMLVSVARATGGEVPAYIVRLR